MFVMKIYLLKIYKQISHKASTVIESWKQMMKLSSWSDLAGMDLFCKHCTNRTKQSVNRGQNQYHFTNINLENCTESIHFSLVRAENNQTICTLSCQNEAYHSTNIMSALFKESLKYIEFSLKNLSNSLKYPLIRNINWKYHSADCFYLTYFVGEAANINQQMLDTVANFRNTTDLDGACCCMKALTEANKTLFTLMQLYTRSIDQLRSTCVWDDREIENMTVNYHKAKTDILFAVHSFVRMSNIPLQIRNSWSIVKV